MNINGVFSGNSSLLLLNKYNGLIALFYQFRGSNVFFCVTVKWLYYFSKIVILVKVL
jgi:hypothetical protein